MWKPNYIYPLMGNKGSKQYVVSNKISTKDYTVFFSTEYQNGYPEYIKRGLMWCVEAKRSLLLDGKKGVKATSNIKHNIYKKKKKSTLKGQINLVTVIY